MERLWAPWRVAYFSEEKPAGCIFCRSGELKERLVLLETPLALVMLNLYPYAAGHLMVAPRRHTASLEELSDAEVLEIHRLVTRCRQALDKYAGPDGFNIGVNLGHAAGAGVRDHLHVHVVPRWDGDNNFICVTADTRVIPEALSATYDRLLPFFREVS